MRWTIRSIRGTCNFSGYYGKLSFCHWSQYLSVEAIVNINVWLFNWEQLLIPGEQGPRPEAEQEGDQREAKGDKGEEKEV